MTDEDRALAGALAFVGAYAVVVLGMIAYAICLWIESHRSRKDRK